MGRGRRGLVAGVSLARERRARGHGVGAGSRGCGRGRARRLDDDGLRRRRHLERRRDHGPEPRPSWPRLPDDAERQRRASWSTCPRAGATRRPDQHAPRRRRSSRPPSCSCSTAAASTRSVTSARSRWAGPTCWPTSSRRRPGCFPAEKYGLTLFDHGAGNDRRLLSTPARPAPTLTVPEMRDGMAAGMARAGIDRFELIYHAACLMSNYETASALAPLSRDHGGLRGDHDPVPGLPGRAACRWPRTRTASRWRRRSSTATAQLLDEDPEAGLGAGIPRADGDVGRRRRGDVAARRRAGVVRRRRRRHMDEIAPEVARARARDPRVRSPVRVRRVQTSSTSATSCASSTRPAGGGRGRPRRRLRGAAGRRPVPGDRPRRPSRPPVSTSSSRPTRGAVRDYLTDGTTPPGWARFVSAFLERGASRRPTARWPSPSETPDVLEEGPGGIKIQGQLASGEATVGGRDLRSDPDGRPRPRATRSCSRRYLDAGGQRNVQGVWDYSLVTLHRRREHRPVTTMLQPQSGGLVGSFDAQYTDPAGARSDFAFRVLLSSEGEIDSAVGRRRGAPGRRLAGEHRRRRGVHAVPLRPLVRRLRSACCRRSRSPTAPQLGVDFSSSRRAPTSTCASGGA